jgi:hypothetical protein
VHVTIDVLDSMIDDRVIVIVGQSLIGLEFVARTLPSRSTMPNTTALSAPPVP